MWKYDITWIMQSYLGEYEGSRSDSDKKFIRAVKSFLAMKDERTQLVIASDGCKITEKLYFKHFKKGDILKAAGYNAPALNQPRGNVLTGNYNIRWTGPLYLK